MTTLFEWAGGAIPTVDARPILFVHERPERHSEVAVRSSRATDKESPRYKNLYSSQVLAGSTPIAVQARTLNGIPPLQINKLFQFS